MKPELERLNNTLEQSIPITRAMGIKAVSYDGTQLRLSAPGVSNLNDKQTIFAGKFGVRVKIQTLAVVAGLILSIFTLTPNF